MFFALRNKSVVRGYAKYGGIFCLIALFLIVFPLIFFGLSRQALQKYCVHDLEVKLEQYVENVSEKNILINKERRTLGSTSLGGIAFIRLIREGEQVFLTDNPNISVELHHLMKMKHDLPAVWVSLSGEDRKGAWVVIETSFDSSLIIQAGSEYSGVFQIYKDLRNITGFAGVLVVVFSFVLTLLIRRWSRKSIGQAEQTLREISQQHKSELLTFGENRELDNLNTLLKKLVQQNRQLIKEMQESLDNVAHDLRTPMTRLRAVAEYGLRQEEPEQLAEALSDCLEESERVLSMLGIMMSVAEAESGTMHLQKQRLILTSTVEDVVNLYEYVAEEKDIELQVNIDETIVFEGDKTRIEQVWANLVDNAIKYGKNKGYVRISAESDGNDTFSISFEDNGMGISESENERIWERLFRGDRSRSQQGLGLGLNYARAVIEAHGGKISVDSELNRGSTFHVRLPCSSQTSR